LSHESSCFDMRSRLVLDLFFQQSLTGNLSWIKLIYLKSNTCRGGGIGRRQGLKIRW
jgi:hypothetical protein